jgi:hypothetical protein
MLNSKENITDSTSNNDVSKKATLPVLVGTGVIMFAGVISCDVNVASQLNTIMNNNMVVTSQESQVQLDNQDDDDSKKGKSKLKGYLKNSAGQLFYDDEAVDDEYYYGSWQNIDDSDEDDFIFWN